MRQYKSCFFFFLYLITSHKLKEPENLESTSERLRWNVCPPPLTALKTTLHLGKAGQFGPSIEWPNAVLQITTLHWRPQRHRAYSQRPFSVSWIFMFQASSAEKEKHLLFCPFETLQKGWDLNLIMCSAERKRANMAGSKSAASECTSLSSGTSSICVWERLRVWVCGKKETSQLSVFM